MLNCITTASNCQPRLHDGRSIGEVRGDTFFKRADVQRYQLRVPPAWASDVAVLEGLQQLDVRFFVIIDDTGVTWRASIADFLSKGIRIDRGHGPQLALLLQDWERLEPSANPAPPVFAEAEVAHA